jgi:hypothetical protein
MFIVTGTLEAFRRRDAVPLKSDKQLAYLPKTYGIRQWIYPLVWRHESCSMACIFSGALFQCTTKLKVTKIPILKSVMHFCGNAERAVSNQPQEALNNWETTVLWNAQQRHEPNRIRCYCRRKTFQIQLFFIMRFVLVKFQLTIFLCPFFEPPGFIERNFQSE